IVGTYQKIESLKQLDNISLERQWAILTEEYKKRFGQKLSMKTQIFTLANIIQNFTDYDIIPSNVQVQELSQALSVFIQELTQTIFGLDFNEIDFHLLMDNAQVRRTIKAARVALEAEEYKKVLKNSSLAFHLGIENQRQKINYLSEKGLLKPEVFMLDDAIKLHLDSQDHEFIHSILGTDTKKLERFKKMVPTVLISEDEKNRPEIVISNYVDESACSKENAQFCLNFVLETILHWEGLELVKK
ncbi:hypothetical protein, partial [[Eubacterium] cellulosolvens]